MHIASSTCSIASLLNVITPFDTLLKNSSEGTQVSVQSPLECLYPAGLDPGLCRGGKGNHRLEIKGGGGGGGALPL